ncbi:MAG: EamA family transporter [Anaerolineae bacterium]|nr:EamA family transporter [Anaerolineae bacterium]
MVDRTKPDQSAPPTADEAIIVSWQRSLAGLGTAFCFAVSAVFIRSGLETLPSPLLGVTIGVLVTAVAYAILLIFQRRPIRLTDIPRDTILFQLLAGIFVALSTWARWVALDMAAVAVVLTLGRLNVPIVILLSPLLVGRHLEKVTARVWMGAVLIIIGSLILNFYS